MKYTFIIFGLFLVAVSAGPTAKSNEGLEAKVNNILKKINQMSNKASTTLKKSLDNLDSDRFRTIEDNLSEIANLRKTNEACVAAMDQKVVESLDNMFNNITICDGEAAKSSANIMEDINTRVSHVVFVGYDVLRLIKTCKSCTKRIMKNNCHKRLATKSNLYLKGAGNSIRAVDTIVTGRVSEAVDNFVNCTKSVDTDAELEVGKILTYIKACIKGE